MKTKKYFRLFTAFLFIAAMIGGLFSVSVKADYDDVKPTKVSVSSAKKSVTVGNEFTLHAFTTPVEAEDDYLVWSIVSGKGVIRFEDNDRTGDDADFVALKKGTAKVCVKIKGTSEKAYITITVKAASKKGTIKRIGKAVRTVEIGDDFDLEVKKSSGVSSRKLKWSIKNSRYVKFAKWEDKKGTEAEFIAKRIGTTKITCKNTATGKSVTFTIKVVPDDDDYDDDDD
ncbi:MAG: hypothetical protein K2M46_03810 [Lachnospiraceae bacterium]|nr:hypothetical protein [Lachnospiraceae bacterium]